MPSPEASALTRQHRSELVAVGRAVVRPVRQLAQGAQVADVDRWLDQVLVRLLQIVRAGWLVARSRGDRYLREHARVEGRVVVPVPAPWTPDRVVASARVTGPAEFKRHLERTGNAAAAKRVMIDTLSRSMQRHALAGDRETVMRTVAESRAIVGWRRVAGGGPCAFCAMLASRGAVYSKATGGFRAHDGCGCTVEPLYEHEDEPDEVQELQRRWREATAGTSGAASLRAWRRYWEGRDGDVRAGG